MGWVPEVERPSASGTAGFGPVSFGAVVLLLLLVAAAVWVARHPRLGQTLWARVRDAPWVRRVWEAPVVRRAWAWSREQVKGKGYGVAGILLLVQLIVVMALAEGFTEVLDDVLEGDGIAGIDRPAAEWLGTNRDLWLTKALLIVTSVGGPAGLAVMTVVISSVVALWRRSWLPIVLALAGAIGILLVVLTAKVLVVRERPPIPFAVITEKGFSFPSGHAAGTAAVVLLSAWLLTRYLIKRWIPQVLVWTVAIGLTGAVGLSRIYLGVHYVSDVVGGWFLGAAWAGGVILVGSWWERFGRGRGLLGDPGRRVHSDEA
ncbi:MAG TPA: phosphatase PAP2 family protein [Mycobacterium sp.]|nr:phosphatase PAP2 family protein [Mycobacterium sp.]